MHKYTLLPMNPRLTVARLAKADDHLSDDIDQLFELTRIIVLVVSSHIPNLSANQPVREVLPDNAVALIALALEALVDVAAVFPVIIRSDLHACMLHIFSSVLSSAACQETLVPNALPILRRFFNGMLQNQQHDTYTQLRSALVRFMTILKTAQRRENAASLACEKNAMLASTILLTSCSAVFSAHDPLLTRVVDELVDCLGNRMTTKVAAGLSRSLLLLPYQQRTAPSTSGAPAVLSSHILPLLLHFLTSPSEIEETDQARSIVASSLTAFAIAAPSQAQKTTACGIITAALLRRASIEGNAVWAETASRFLEMVGAIPVPFRSVVAALGAEHRALLEEILRAGAGASRTQKSAQETEREPTIALKMDF